MLEQVGQRLRAARMRHGWTLEQLATRAGMSASTLSRLESGKRQANLELLVPLTRHLGIRIDDLLPEPDRDPRVRRPAVSRGGVLIAPLTADQSPVQTFKVTYPAGGTVPEPRVHEGYEWLYVLSGRLHLRLGEQELVLGRGEAAEFDTRTPHAMWAAGGRAAEILSIFNGEGMRMHVRGADE